MHKLARYGSRRARTWLCGALLAAAALAVAAQTTESSRGGLQVSSTLERIAPGIDGDFQKARAQRLHLFFHRAAHIIGFDNRPQTFGSGNSLKPRNPCAKNQGFDRADGASRRGEHWKKTSA